MHHSNVVLLCHRFDSHASTGPLVSIVKNEDNYWNCESTILSNVCQDMTMYNLTLCMLLDLFYAEKWEETLIVLRKWRGSIWLEVTFSFALNNYDFADKINCEIGNVSYISLCD